MAYCLDGAGMSDELYGDELYGDELYGDELYGDDELSR